MEEINLKDFFAYLKGFIIAIAITTVVAVGAVTIYDTQIKTPMYSTYTKVLLLQSNDNQNANTALNDINVNQKLAGTYSEFVKSRLVLQQVLSDLEIEDLSVEQLAKNITVTNIENTQVLQITVRDADAKRARDLADKTTEVFASKITKLTGLDNVKPYESATVNEYPNNDTLARDIVITAILSIFGVIGIAFVIFYFDDSIKYSQNLEHEVQIPIAGKIIRNEINDKTSTHSELVAYMYPKALVSESIKALRTNLQFSSVDRGFKTILVTSSLPSEGKSFISANLAISFVQTSKRVLIVDCDLRRGRLHNIFNVPNLYGLSNLFADDLLNIGNYIQKTCVKNLDIITRGAFPPNPSELLASNKNRAIIENLKERYDIIIFDGAPCNGVTDSVVLSKLVDEVLIVARDGKTSRSAFESTRDSLTKVDAPIAGIIVNDINKKVSDYYYYGSDSKKHRSGKNSGKKHSKTARTAEHNAANQ